MLEIDLLLIIVGYKLWLQFPLCLFFKYLRGARSPFKEITTSCKL